MPSLEVLNVNYNFLEDLAGLKGMRSLRKVSVVGNRLEGGDRGLKGLESLEEVDLR
jgi:Leucine-rich repeat (LRR) protein